MLPVGICMVSLRLILCADLKKGIVGFEEKAFCAPLPRSDSLSYGVSFIGVHRCRSHALVHEAGSPCSKCGKLHELPIPTPEVLLVLEPHKVVGSHWLLFKCLISVVFAQARLLGPCESVSASHVGRKVASVRC